MEYVIHRRLSLYAGVEKPDLKIQYDGDAKPKSISKSVVFRSYGGGGVISAHGVELEGLVQFARESCGGDVQVYVVGHHHLLLLELVQELLESVLWNTAHRISILIGKNQ